MAKKIKDGLKEESDNLFGLLSSYKIYNTYVNLYVSEKDDTIIILLAENPKSWEIMREDEYKDFRIIKRLEAGLPKLSIKYIMPVHLINVYGICLGMKIPSNRITIKNELKEKGLYMIKMPGQYKSEVLQIIKKIITMTPQKKYEILEKCLAESTKER